MKICSSIVITLLFAFSLFNLAYSESDVSDLKPIVSTYCALSNTFNVTINLTEYYLTCNSSLGEKTCQVQPSSLIKNFTLYAIGELKATGGGNPLIWFRLYPRKEDNSGWWYYRGINSESSRYLLQPKGKSSKTDAGYIVMNDNCWSTMNSIIKASMTRDTIKAEKYNKGLIEKPYEKTKMIGTLIVL